MKHVRAHLAKALFFSTLALPAAAQTAAEMETFTAQMQNATEADKKAFCGEMRKMAEELTSQLPLQVDPTTQLNSASAVYLGGTCSYNLGYVINEAKLFKMLKDSISQQKGEEVPMDFVEQFYSTGHDGYKMLKQGLQNSLQNNPDFAPALALPFVQIRAEYVVQGSHMDDFYFVLGEGS